MYRGHRNKTKGESSNGGGQLLRLYAGGIVARWRGATQGGAVERERTLEVVVLTYWLVVFWTRVILFE